MSNSKGKRIMLSVLQGAWQFFVYSMMLWIARMLWIILLALLRRFSVALSLRMLLALTGINTLVLYGLFGIALPYVLGRIFRRNGSASIAVKRLTAEHNN